MWQNNEQAALSGNRTIRRIEDEGGHANQFAMVKKRVELSRGPPPLTMGIA